MNERRIKEICIHCGGESLTWKTDGKLRKICLICGKDFEAKRESDIHKFHKEADAWVS